MENKDKDFIDNYLEIADGKNDDVVIINKDARIVISNDNSEAEIGLLISACILNLLKNKTIINYESDDIPDRLSKLQKSLSNKDTESREIAEIDNIVIDFADPEEKKTPIKAIYKILNAKLSDDGEFDKQPIKEIFGSFDLLEKPINEGQLFYYKDNEEYAFWGYRFQPDFIGGPGDFIVLYGENEIELVRGIDNVIMNYRFPSLQDALDVE